MAYRNRTRSAQRAHLAALRTLERVLPLRIGGAMILKALPDLDLVENRLQVVGNALVHPIGAGLGKFSDTRHREGRVDYACVPRAP